MSYYLTNAILVGPFGDLNICWLRPSLFLFFIEYRCNADTKGSKIVPIAVGCILVGLVLIVILAYIVGRMRSHKRRSSYEALS